MTELNQLSERNLPCAVILTAISDEFRAVRAFLSSVTRVKHPGGTIYQQGFFIDNGRTWRIAVCEIGAGNAGAALEAERAIAYFSPQVMAFVGVAGGLKDVSIGDVVAATKIYGYEAGKAKEQFQTRPEVFRSSYELEQEARAAANEDTWVNRLKTRPVEIPRAFVAPMAAGEKVVASTYSEAWSLIREHYGDALAVEMEGMGFLKAGHANQAVKAMVVRGISDLVDKKDEADATGSQAIAAERAAAFLFEILAHLDTDSPSQNQPVTPPEPAAIVINAPEENSFFTGRTDILDRIGALLQQGRRVALHGMSGIGKSQIAGHYGHLHCADYDFVFWVSADTPEVLLSDYVVIARQVLPQLRDEVNQGNIVQAMKTWLNTHSGWLLVLDNVDDLNTIRNYLPPNKMRHIIITTTQSTFGNTAVGVEVDDLSPEIGATLLLRRAKRIAADAELDTATPEDHDAALALSGEMQGLPLALDQAGAYIEDVGRTPAQYLELYRKRNTDLLAERGDNPIGHPNSVTITLSLALSKLEQINPAAAELLKACAVLAPFRIPEELFTLAPDIWKGTLSLSAGDEINWGHVIKAAKNLSLLRHNADDRSLWFHQLVPLLIRDQMTAEEQCLTVEKHVRAINSLLAFYGEASVQGTVEKDYGYERLKLQIGWIGLLVEFYKIYTVEAAQIYYNTGLYLKEHGIYGFAKDLLSFTVTIFTNLAGPEHPQMPELFNRLAMCYYYLDQPDEAEAYYNRAIDMASKAFGDNHSSVGIYYDNLVGVYVDQKRYVEAAEAAKKASAIIAKSLGAEHDDMAISISNQASLLLRAGDEEQAEEAWLKSIAIIEANNGPDDYQLALPMQNLAMFYIGRKQDEKTETLLRKSLTVLEAKFGSKSARLIQVLNNLGSLYIVQEHEEEAAPYLVRAIDIMRESRGGNDADYARALNNLGVLLDRLKRHDEAKPILEESVAVREDTFGKEHPETATGYKNLGVNYSFQQRYDEAEALYKRALEIREKEYGMDSPPVDMVLTDYVDLLRKVDRLQEADEMHHRSEAIRSDWDNNHPPPDAVRDC